MHVFGYVCLQLNYIGGTLREFYSFCISLLKMSCIYAMTTCFIILLSASLQKSASHLTEQTIERHAQMVGQMDTSVREIFGSSSRQTFVKTKDVDMSVDIELFLDHMRDEEVFKLIPGRCHRSFPNFCYDGHFKNPSKILTKLSELSKRLDRSRTVLG